MKGLEEVEKLGRNEGTLHCLPRSSVMSDCSNEMISFLKKNI